MSSSYKTDFLKLNKWIDDDKPKRTDFVNDNEKIDLAVKEHFNNTASHVTIEDKKKWNEGGFDLANHIISGTYVGDGSENRAIVLDKNINFVVAFISNKSPFSYFSVTKTLYQYLAVATAKNNTSAIKVEGNKFYVTTNFTPATQGESHNLNDSGQEYGYFAFCS